jgi:parallel beta-helix repeat protein
MRKLVVLLLTFTLFLGVVTILTVPVKAVGTVYIKSDGSIDPPSTPISTVDNVTYAFDADINDPIIIQRNDIILDGQAHILGGTGSGYGIDLTRTNNVTIQNITIIDFAWAITSDMVGSSNNKIVDNQLLNNGDGIVLHSSSGYEIRGNNIATSTSQDGIWLWNSSSNLIVENNIAMNLRYGICLGSFSENNLVIKNNITRNGNAGVSFDAYFNTIFHNNFENNTMQTAGSTAQALVWDNGYIYGGNFWSDYNGTDFDDDGIGDTPYIIDENNIDHYPLINPWSPPDLEMVCFETLKNITREGSRITFDTQFVYQGNTEEVFKLDVYLNGSLLNSEILILPGGHHWYTTRIWNTTGFAKGNYTVTALLEPLQDEVDTADNTMTTYVFITIGGDLNGDKTVDIYDAVILANHFGHPPWYLWGYNSDINDDGVIDIFDAIMLANNFGKSWT